MVQFINDDPIQTPQEDLLGYDQFAEDVAQLLASQSSEAGFVLSINGEWGSGKSSCVNMIKYYLENNHSPKTIFFDFSPWFFNGSKESLFQDFFVTLLKAIQNVVDLSKKSIKAVYDELNALLRCITIEAKAKCNFFSGNMQIDFCKLPSNNSPTILELKDKIVRRLKKSKKKIIIFIDDLDRLNKEEVLQIFSLIKSVANFPNIIYVLSCDRKILTNILQVEQGIEGEKYLEKIIQISLDLPLPETSLLEKYLINDIDFGDKINIPIFTNYYTNGIKQILNTPRKIKRFRQNFDVFFSFIKEDLNVADFFALTFLRLYSPKTYQSIKDNIGWLAMTDPCNNFYYVLSDIEKTKIYQIAKEILNTIEQENPSVSKNDWELFLGEMFPNFRKAINNQEFQTGYEITDLENGRIFCGISALRYFRYNYYSTIVTRKQFNDMLETINQKGDFNKYIEQHLVPQKFEQTSLSFRLLQRVKAKWNQLPSLKQKIIIHDLLCVGFKYDNDNDIENIPFYRITFSSLIQDIIFLFFKSMTPQNRELFLEKYIKKIPFAFLCSIFAFDKQYWDDEFLEKMKTIFVQRIEGDSKRWILEQNYRYILNKYKYLCPDKFGNLLQTIAPTDSKKIAILAEVCPQQFNGIWYINEVFNSPEIHDLISTIKKESLSSEDKNLLDLFIQTAEKSGKFYEKI